MKKTNKKGFTLVELLVVIAILAILASVSVVGYLSFTKKAKESNDISLVSQLNTLLKGEETTDGKPNTMSEALKVVEEGGFNVEKMTPTSQGYVFVWDKGENQFLLLNNNNEIVAPANATDTSKIDTFGFAKNKEDINKLTQLGYGSYLTNKYSDELPTVSRSIDTGTKPFDVNFVNEVDDNTNQVPFIISTNGGNLTVNAPKATINHYGSSNKTTITAVADNSYHEFGSVALLDVTKGRIVAEAKAIINGIYVNTNNVKVEVNTSAKVNETACAPSVNVTINGNKVVEKDKTEFTTSTLLFAGGNGTKESPYLLNNRTQFENISKLYGTFGESIDFKGGKLNTITNGKYSYFKVNTNSNDWEKDENGNIHMDGSNWPYSSDNYMALNGSLDGSGLIIDNLDAPLFKYAGGMTVDNTVYEISNLEINANINKTGLTGSVALIRNAVATNFVINNVNVHGTIVGSDSTASYIGYGTGQYCSLSNNQPILGINITFNNCISDATVSSQGQAGGFVGHPYSKSDESTITIHNSVYRGKMEHKSGSNNGYIAANVGGYEKIKVHINHDDNFNVDGQPNGDISMSTKYSNNAHALPVLNHITHNPDFTMTVKKAANASYAEAYVYYQYTPGGITGDILVEKRLSDDGSSFTTLNKINKFTLNGASTEEGVYNIKIEGATRINSLTLRIVQYDAKGNVLGFSLYSISQENIIQ